MNLAKETGGNTINFNKGITKKKHHYSLNSQNLVLYINKWSSIMNID